MKVQKTLHMNIRMTVREAFLKKKADDEIHAYQYDSPGRLSHSQSSKDGIQSINTTDLCDIEDRLQIQKWNIGSDAGSDRQASHIHHS